MMCQQMCSRQKRESGCGRKRNNDDNEVEEVVILDEGEMGMKGR